MNIFEKLDIDESKLHPKFKTIRDHLIFGEHEVLKGWTNQFVDRDNKIVKEFQATFHSSFWEFYLFAFLLEAGLEVDFSENRPDFIISAPEKIYIEAVVANIKENGKKENNRNIDDIYNMILPFYKRENFNYELNEAITRYSNSILSKSKKYNEYKKLRYFKDDSPYVIALSGYEQINYGNGFIFPMMALLYGRVYNNFSNSYSDRTFIIKPDSENTEIPIGIFLDEQFSHVSAIIFSCTVTLGKLTSLAISDGKIHPNGVLTIRQNDEVPNYLIQLVSKENPEFLSDGVFIFHNPKAKNPLNPELFDKTNAVNVIFDTHDKSTKRFANNLPLVSRLNLAFGKPMLPILCQEAFNDFNPEFLILKVKIKDYLEEVDGYTVYFIEQEDGVEIELFFNEIKFKEYQIVERKLFVITFYIDITEQHRKIANTNPKFFETIKKMEVSSGNAHIFDIRAL